MNITTIFRDAQDTAALAALTTLMRATNAHQAVVTPDNVTLAAPGDDAAFTAQDNLEALAAEKTVHAHIQEVYDALGRHRIGMRVGQTSALPPRPIAVVSLEDLTSTSGSVGAALAAMGHAVNLVAPAQRRVAGLSLETLVEGLTEYEATGTDRMLADLGWEGLHDYLVHKVENQPLPSLITKDGMKPNPRLVPVGATLTQVVETQVVEAARALVDSYITSEDLD